MFFRGRFFIRTLLVLLLVGIFASVAGRWSYNAGWSDGYYTAQAQEGSGDGATVAPSPAHGFGPTRGWGFGPVGWFFGGLLKFWLFLLLIGLGLKLLAGHAWGGGRHHRHGDWHDRREEWHRRHGERHHERGRWPYDWRDERDAPHEKRPEDVDPDIRGA
jgi:hypothetical protein